VLCRRRSPVNDRAQEAPAAENLATLIARYPAGISRIDLARALRLPEETVEQLPRALLAVGQVVVLKVDGKIVFRAA
jgi:hypothetical protein